MKKYSFKAAIEAGRGGGAFVRFPYDVEETFGVQGQVPVTATFDGIPDSGALMKYLYPQHILGVAKSVRERGGKRVSDVVDVVLWKDQAPGSSRYRRRSQG